MSLLTSMISGPQHGAAGQIEAALARMERTATTLGANHARALEAQTRIGSAIAPDSTLFTKINRLADSSEELADLDPVGMQRALAGIEDRVTRLPDVRAGVELGVQTLDESTPIVNAVIGWTNTVTSRMRGLHPTPTGG